MPVRRVLGFVALTIYATLVVPLVVLIGSGFARMLARLAPWLVLPRMPAVRLGPSSPSQSSASTPSTG